MKHIFIIGSRGLPAQYGGFETFVEELVSHQVSMDLIYHVACLSDEHHGQHWTYKGADCFSVCPPRLGPARVIAYDMMAIRYALKLVKSQQIERPIFYILGNTIGGWIAPFVHWIHRVGGQVFVNPDGLEWKRAKWPRPVRAYLRYAEKKMAQHADLLIADNPGIADYLTAHYPSSTSHCIAYGTDSRPTTLTIDSPEVRTFFSKWGLREKGYYLILGRFVPENNYATMIREFMQTKTKRDLVLICNHEGLPYFQQLLDETGCQADQRIKFVGTVYDKELVRYLRAACRAYIHGHEVGGTNPGLLEALSHTNENLVLDVSFNRTVAGACAHYWTKEEGSLSDLIDRVDQAAEDLHLGQTAKTHMRSQYSWEKIVQQYEELFLQ